MDEFLVFVELLGKQLDFHLEEQQLFVMLGALGLLDTGPVELFEMSDSVPESLDFSVLFNGEFFKQLVVFFQILVFEQRCFILVV